MTLLILALAGGLLLLVVSANWFVDGAVALARHFGIPSLVIGMVIVGFGTSAPEMVVSAMSALEGAPSLALGNAYGSNIANIGLILGIAALMRPIAVHSDVLRRELPILLAITGVAAWQLRDDALTRFEALVLLGIFAGLLAWTIRQSRRAPADALAADVDRELEGPATSRARASLLLAAGLALLIASSRLLVWGATGIALQLGVSELVIGLTIVAIGTSLPELASTLVAARRGEHDLALGNVLGSNLFNTLAVVGIAGAIEPMDVEPALLTRDVPVMAGFCVALFAFAHGFGGPGRVGRLEGAVLVAAYAAYATLLAL